MKTNQTLSNIIKCFRPMTKEEMNREGWSTPATVIELTDGSILYPSRDEEGNDAGCLFGRTKEGHSFILS